MSACTTRLRCAGGLHRRRSESITRHVVPTQSYRLHRPTYRPEESGGADEEYAAKVASGLLEELGRKHLGQVRWRAEVRHASNPATAILQAQRELGSDLIVVSKSAASELSGRIQGAAKDRLKRFAAQHLGEIPHETAVMVAYDRAAAILDDEKGWKPDVIVMGTFGLTDFFQLVLGSTAETVARRSLASVVTLRLRT